MPAAGGWNYQLLEKLFQALPHNAKTDRLFDFVVRNSLISTWIFAAAFYVFWTRDDNRTAWRRGQLLQIVISLAIVLMASLLVRPWIAWPAPSVNPNFQVLYPQYLWNTGTADCFPSHSTLIYFTVAAGLWPLSRRVSLILSAAVLGMISLPRVYVGGHYPVDVLASLLLTLFILPLAWRWRVPEAVTNWLNEKGYSTSTLLRELVLILWLFELGEGFNGSTDMLKYIYHYLFH
jgi:undecaprenyl-diphosphatase